MDRRNLFLDRFRLAYPRPRDCLSPASAVSEPLPGQVPTRASSSEPFQDFAFLAFLDRFRATLKYFLGLAMTDLDQVKCKVLPKIADHKGLWLRLPLPAPRSISLVRTVWNYRDADWEGLKEALARQNWLWLQHVDANTGAQQLTDLTLAISGEFITKRNFSERKTTHPWVGERVLELVREKKAAEGTNRERECRDRCSAGIMEEYGK